jgi:hypothetical protein
LLVLLLTTAIAATPAESGVSAAAVQRMLDRLGPKRTVDKLAGGKGADKGEYEEVVEA